MDPIVALDAAALGYLLGSLSFARIVVRIFAPRVDIGEGVEIEIPGSEEKVQLDAIAGTVVATKLGERYGCLSASLDMLKVAAPTLAFRLAHPDAPYFLIAAALGVVGHDRPLYYRFKGGRGLSAIYGGFLVIDPIGTLFTSLVALLVGLLMKNILVSYLAGTWLMIPWFWFRTADPAYLAYVVAVNIMFMLVLIPEISFMRDRQRRGVEVDFDAALEATPMGRGLKKLATRLGLSHSGQ